MEKILQKTKKYILFVLGSLILIWGYSSNEKYKEVNDIDSSTGATQSTN